MSMNQSEPTNVMLPAAAQEKMDSMASIVQHYGTDLTQLLEKSPAAKTFMDAVNNVYRCSEFYAFIMSVDDSTVSEKLRSDLTRQAYDSLDRAKLNLLISDLKKRTSKKTGDYSYRYMMVILKLAEAFAKTEHYKILAESKKAFDADTSTTAKQIRTILASVKHDVEKLASPLQTTNAKPLLK